MSFDVCLVRSQSTCIQEQSSSSWAWESEFPQIFSVVAVMYECPGALAKAEHHQKFLA